MREGDYEASTIAYKLYETNAVPSDEQIFEDVAAVLGTPGNPMTRDQVVAKCRGLMTPVLGNSASAKLIERALDIERIKNVRELRPFLQRP